MTLLHRLYEPTEANSLIERDRTLAADLLYDCATALRAMLNHPYGQSRILALDALARIDGEIAEPTGPEPGTVQREPYEAKDLPPALLVIWRNRREAEGWTEGLRPGVEPERVVVPAPPKAPFFKLLIGGLCG